MNWEVRTMRSGTSYFNSPLFQKNLARFWPVWAVYGLIWAFILPLQFLVLPGRDYISAGELPQRMLEQAQRVGATLNPGVAISFFFGLFAAMSVFSYLFSSRSACMVHSLPLDRRGLFVTNYLSGLAFLVLPNVAIFLLTLAVEAAYGCVVMDQLVIWLLVQSATALFFYSFAVFCAMFTGSLLAMPAFYGILSFLAYVVYSLLTEVLSSFLYGSWGLGSGLDNVVLWFTPLFQLTAACRWSYDPVDSSGLSALLAPDVVVIYAAVGLVLTVLALTVYRQRHVESAGDVVAIRIVRPIFKYGVALCSGLCFGVGTCIILGFDTELVLAVFVLLWAAVGYFVAEMLLCKSFRVWKSWKGCAVLACLLCLLFAAVELDWFGYEGRVPQPDQVQSIRIYSAPTGAPYDAAYSNGGAMVITQPEQIEEIIALHQAIVDQRGRQDEFGDDSIYLTLEYTLSNGQTFRRRYSSVLVFQNETDTPGTVTYAAQALLNDRDYVRTLYGLDDHGQDRLVEAYLNNMWSEDTQSYQDSRYLDRATGQDLEKLWQAVLLDFDQGTIGVRYLFENGQARNENTYTADLNFVWEQGAPGGAYVADELSITLTPQASHTLAVLSELGVDVESGDLLMTHQQMVEKNS